MMALFFFAQTLSFAFCFFFRKSSLEVIRKQYCTDANNKPVKQPNFVAERPAKSFEMLSKKSFLTERRAPYKLLDM